VEHLLRRYGVLAQEVLDLVAGRPELGEPLEGAEDHLRAEVVYAASHEGALHLTDVLTRRTRISIEAWDRGVSAAPHAAALVAPVLGWDESRTAEEIAIYLGRVEAERVSQTMPDDASADEARRSGPDDRI
jgi:glycerol-3-phosphate dehydrogenase